MDLEVTKIIRETLKNFDGVEVISEDEYIIFFTLLQKQFGIIFSVDDLIEDMPILVVKDEEKYDFPHIMYREQKIDEHKYRELCLFENDSFVNFLMSITDKVELLINQLIKLLSLSKIGKEKEFQKEFLFYWNKQKTNRMEICVFINSDNFYQKLNVYKNNVDEYQLVSNGKKLNIKDAWKHIPNIGAFYIPIIDCRNIMPPVKDNLWTNQDILKIINGRDIARISHDTYEQLGKEKIKTNCTYLIFEMISDGISINFCCKVTFENSQQGNLLEKLKNSILSVEAQSCKRCDYDYLNRQIGNDTSVLKNKVAVIGAGSLGSYIATELVKSGIKDLTIFDGDYIEEQNLLRHTIKYGWSGFSKAIALKYSLQQFHPEIIVDSKGEDITPEKLKEIMSKFNLIIFTVGSSNIQFQCNRMFKKEQYNKPVIYTWLEAGGINSHILSVNYSKQGCLECLFTNPDGKFINNKANQSSDTEVENNTIRNGCGGTRVAYGTEILLSTTSVVLNTVKKVLNDELKQNSLIDIALDKVIVQGNTFIERKCKCCGE